jgi:hypothetical protein
MRVFALLIVIACAAAVAKAEEGGPKGQTVSSLLREGFAIAAAIQSQPGPAGLFLQKKDQLYFCVVSETKTSAALTTQYCKTVE